MTLDEIIPFLPHFQAILNTSAALLLGAGYYFIRNENRSLHRMCMVTALVISAVTLVALFVADPVYQKVVVGAALWYAAGLLWFALVGRRRLVYSPEERFAVEASAHSDDEA